MRTTRLVVEFFAVWLGSACHSSRFFATHCCPQASAGSKNSSLTSAMDALGTDDRIVEAMSP